MEPEDVLDFGEDDDGLDVISLGGSDHDGRPVSNRSSSTALESATRSIRQPRPSPPTQSRNPRSTPTRNLMALTGFARNLHIEQPITLKQLTESAIINLAHAPLIAQHPVQTGALTSRMPRGMPNARLQPRRRVTGLRAIARDLAKGRRTCQPIAFKPYPLLRVLVVFKYKPDSGRPIASLSTRITDQRDANQTPSKPLSPSKPAAEREKVEEVKNVEKAVEPSDEIASTAPEGWISRISKVARRLITSMCSLGPANGSYLPSPLVANQPNQSRREATAQETSEIRTQPSRGDRLKNDNVAPATDSTSTIVSQDDRHHVAPQEPLRHHETSKPAKDDHHSTSNNMDPENAHASDSDIDGQSIQQEKTQPDISEPHSRDHRIHPDRRQEIASSMHPDRRQEIASLNSSRARESAPEHCKSKPVASFLTEFIPDLELSNEPVVNTDSAIIATPSPFGQHRDSPRQGRPPAILTTLIDFAQLSIPGLAQSLQLHVAPPLIVSGSVISENVPVQLSGSNGIPTGPGRSFPEPITPSQPHEMFINTEVSRYSRPLSISSKTAEPSDPRDMDRRRGPDHTYDRDITNQDRRPSSWSRQEGGIISPLHPPQRHPPTLRPSSPSPHRRPSVLRPRSPSPPPRRMQTSIQGASRAHMQSDLYPDQRSRSPPPSSRVIFEDRTPGISQQFLTQSGTRAHLQPDLYPAERSRPSPASSRALPEDRPIQAPEQSDLIRRNPASRLSPRPVHAPGVSPRHTQPIKYYPIIDLDEIPHKHDTPSAPSTLRNTHVPPSPACPIKEAPQSSHRQESDRSQNLKHSKHTSDKQVNLPTKDRREVPSNDSQKSLTEGGAKPPPNEARKPPPPDVKKMSQKDGNKVVENDLKEPSNKTLAIPKQQDRTGARGRSIEADEISEKGAMASSDIIEILPPQSVQVPHEPLKQSISLPNDLDQWPTARSHDELSPPLRDLGETQSIQYTRPICQTILLVLPKFSTGKNEPTDP
ncbi:hypothetical protein PSTT_12887 [Puccinia striiformis]|uniref:Uncharacterized protein n=1 Tax=Puccinia striiformis TaxID=27350 RepID=A0A2S4UUB1_9BASI|nr:hypothetical protein PSTT_12887 [Puccinia striiformis]